MPCKTQGAWVCAVLAGLHARELRRAEALFEGHDGTTRGDACWYCDVIVFVVM